jgi:hypothetical protein
MGQTEFQGESPVVTAGPKFKIRVKGKIKVKDRIKVKGSGQECPFHTCEGKGNINVNTNAARVRGSHVSQKRRNVGHPLCFLRTLIHNLRYGWAFM